MTYNKDQWQYYVLSGHGAPIVVFSIIVLVGGFLLWRKVLGPNRRATTPGRVPRGIPDRKVSAKGYQWLRRNEYGVIDMSQYTPEQWRDTKLPYCRTHMKHPGEAVHYVTRFDEYGNAWAGDVCDCGHLLGADRAVLCRNGLFGQWLRSTVGYAALNGISHAYSNPNAVQGLEQSVRGDVNFSAFAFGVVSWRNHRLKDLVGRVLLHPEIEGIWVTRAGFERYGSKVEWRNIMCQPIWLDRRWDGERWTAPYYPPEPEPTVDDVMANWGGPFTFGNRW